jgi:hypothetical protein
MHVEPPDSSPTSMSRDLTVEPLSPEAPSDLPAGRENEQAAARTDHATRDRALQTRLQRLTAEVAELRTALLTAEGELSQMRQLEADLGELRAVMEQMREIDARMREVEADRDHWLTRYELVVNATSWRLTAPLRDVAARMRERRTDR